MTDNVFAFRPKRITSTDDDRHVRDLANLFHSHYGSDADLVLSRRIQENRTQGLHKQADFLQKTKQALENRGRGNVVPLHK